MPGHSMRLTDLRDKIVRTLDGDPVGRVHEVHAEGGRIVALSCGAASLIERLTTKAHGQRILWERVVKITPKHIVVGPDAPANKSRSAASRSRQGTRRPSARRSKR